MVSFKDILLTEGYWWEYQVNTGDNDTGGGDVDFFTKFEDAYDYWKKHGGRIFLRCNTGDVREKIPYDFDYIQIDPKTGKLDKDSVMGRKPPKRVFAEIKRVLKRKARTRNSA